jgi:hypothetical protein
MDLIECAYRDFAQMCIKEGKTQENCMEHMYSIHSDFQTNENFKIMFPKIFRIEYLKHITYKMSTSTQLLKSHIKDGDNTK